MSDAFNKLMAEHRRLVILRALASTNSGGESNDSILQSIAVDAGVTSSRDQIRTALSWLAEQDLVTVRALESGAMVATITQSGIDVATRKMFVPGVQPPAPGLRHG